MSAMTRFTLRSLAANRVRTLVTVAGVALAAALLTAVLSSYASLEDYLYRSEVQSNGIWTAQVRVDGTDAALAVEGAKDVRATASLTDVGFAENNEEAQTRFGRYLPVLAAEGDVGEVCGIVPTEGRLPVSADELMLPERYRSLLGTAAASTEGANEGVGGEGGDAQPIELGDEVALALGQREAVVAGGQGVEVTMGQWRSDYGMCETTLTDGMRLDSDFALVTAGPSAESPVSERLADVQQHRYTVVGFYDRANLATMTSFGAAALCGADPQVAGTTALYAVVDGVASASQLEERMRELFPGTEPYLHSSLLRAMGVRSSAGIWDTFYAMVCVLAVVIVVACVSLIYNAFAISVAERARQFGLLASIGASKRQMRRAVLFEALVVAAVGVPLGVALGLGATAVVLAALGPSLSQILVEDAAFGLSVRPAVLAAAAALALAAVLVSAWLPARQAARGSVVDSLRRAPEGRATRRALRAASKGAAVRHPWKSRSLGGRMFGLGGQMAHVNAKRGMTRGRTASLSLALAVVLLMTAGSLTTYLSVLVDATGLDAGGHDLEVNAYSSTGSGAQALGAYQEVYEALGAVDGAEPLGFAVNERVAMLVPEGVAGTTLEAGASMMGGPVGSGLYGADGSIVGLDDEGFRAYAASCGVDASRFFDPTDARAIAIGQAYGNDGNAYLYSDVFSGPGTVEVVTGALYQGEAVESVGLHATQRSDGAMAYRLVTIAPNDPTGEGVALDETEATLTPVEVAAVASEGPALRSSPYQPTLVMPASMLEPWGLLAPFELDSLSFCGAYGASDHAAVALAMEDVAEDLQPMLGSVGESFLSVQDRRAALDDVQALILVVNVFCLLFTVVLALIALANVFNTITNGLILRRREFAVMKSVGMGNRTFRSMIASEAVRYSLRGLVPGLVVAALVSWALYQAMAMSVKGLAFALPWGYMGLSVALVAVALLLSVAYGLHRCKASNVVEALRDIM